MPEHPSATPDSLTKPVVPRPAASLLVLRFGKRTEILMGMRGATHRFMPNKLVFPGGRVDAEDHAVEPATAPPPHVQDRLARGSDASLARAIGIAAARELEEETGLSLGWPPRLHGIDYLCRAITPENSPIRFDARFLIVEESHIGGSLAGSGELEDLSWYDLAAARDRTAPPTNQVLDQLDLWLAMDAAARLGRVLVPTLRNQDGGQQMRWHLE